MCIFCKIVAGEIPSHRVYENESTLAFLDVAPVNPGHTLVIPKEHYQNIEEVPKDVLCEVMQAVKIIGSKFKKNLGVAGYNIMENNDPLAGQIIPHLHFHVIPRQEGDGLKLWPQGKYSEGEAEEVVKSLKL